MLPSENEDELHLTLLAEIKPIIRSPGSSIPLFLANPHHRPFYIWAGVNGRNRSTIISMSPFIIGRFLVIENWAFFLLTNMVASVLDRLLKYNIHYRVCVIHVNVQNALLF